MPPSEGKLYTLKTMNITPVKRRGVSSKKAQILITVSVNLEKSTDLNHCNDIFQKPLMITECEHTFCGLCLTEWLRTNEKNPLWPECKVPVEPNDESVKQGMFVSRLINSFS